MENTEPILSVVRTQDNPIGRGISRDFTENPFVSPLFSTQTFQYTLSIPPPPTLPFPKKISNDYDIPEGNSEMANNIEKQAIQQFLQRSEKRDEETMTFSFSTISSVCKSQVPWKFGIKSPPIGYSLPLKYLQVKLKSMSYANQKSDITDFQGTLFLYASKRHQYLSESLRFTRTLNSTVFEHTSTDTCYFEVQPPSEDIYLVCVLMHQSAYSLDNFLKALTGERPIPQQQFASVIPFAFSYIPLYSLFTKSGEVDLTFPVWIKYSSSEHFKYIGCEVTPPEVQTLPINSSVNLVVMTDKEIPINLSQTGEIQMPKSPIMALSVPFLLHPKPSIMLSGIHMKFNSLPKCEFLYFKVFYCEDPRDPVNPTGMKVFLPKNDDGSSSNCFTSKPIPVSKKPIFTDCVRMVLDKPLKSTSHLVIHINSIQKSGLSTLRIVIVPLIIENNPIQTSTQTYTMISSKRLKPNEYLSKLNANGKKSLKMNIDTTSIFFVPKTLNTLSNAIVPQQINLKEILEVPVKTIRQQFIPISSKLLSLSSSTSLQALIEIYQYCKSEIVKHQFKNWLYHVFNPIETKHNFLYSYTSSIEKLIQESLTKDNNLLPTIIDFFEFIIDIFLISYVHETEEYNPTNLYNFLKQISNIICFYIQKDQTQIIKKISKLLGSTLVILFSFSSETFLPIIANHLRTLLRIKTNQISVLTAFFSFLTPFTSYPPFILLLIKQLPVEPLKKRMFSPFQPIISLFELGFSRAMTLKNGSLYMFASEFLTKLCLPLETEDDEPLNYRIAYALFPFLDLFSYYYKSNIPEEAKFELIPSILLIIGYSPSQLLRNYFSSTDLFFQVQFIEFIESACDICINRLTLQKFSNINNLFVEMTQRILRFLRCTIYELKNSISNIINLLFKLTNNKHQSLQNYPLIFDIFVKIINKYPINREYINEFVKMFISKYHITKCFSISSFIIFFRKDYLTRKNVIISTVQFLDSFISVIQEESSNDINIFKESVKQIQRSVKYYHDKTFKQKLCDRLSAALSNAEIIEKLKNSQFPPDIKCFYIMQLADQSKNFPSMRVRWLKEIVKINAENKWFVSAYVAQLHICSLTSTILRYYKTKNENTENTSTKLVMVQPLTNSKQQILSSESFTFFPPVMIENNINFEYISDDFRFLSADFNMEFLKSSLKNALEFALKAKMYYDARCVLSLLLRIALNEANLEDLTNISNQLSEVFKEMKANYSLTVDSPLHFYLKNKRIYCLDHELNQNGFVPLVKIEGELNSVEFPHTFSMFRTVVKKSQLEVSSLNEKEITINNYKTKESLPSYSMFSEVEQEKTQKLSIIDYLNFEEKITFAKIRKVLSEYEGFLPNTLKNRQSKGEFQFELNRIGFLLHSSLNGDNSYLFLLLLISKKFDKESVIKNAKEFKLLIKRLLVTYSEIANFTRDETHMDYAQKFNNTYNSFVEFFDIDKDNNEEN